MTATLDALAGEADGRADRRGGRPPDPPLPDRARASSSSTRSSACSRTRRRRRSARASCASSCRAPSACSAPSTAEAVRTVRESRRAAGRRSARGWRPSCTAADVLADGVEDQPDNVDPLRVARARRRRREPGRSARKTSIVFWGFNDESPGRARGRAARALDRGINLTKIESRPRRVRLGHYMFFADLEGARRASRRCARRSRRSPAGRGAAGAGLIRRCASSRSGSLD